MTLSLVFRIHAVMFALFGVGMLFTPQAMMEGFNVGENALAETLLQGMSVMVLAIAYINWQMPSWAGDNLKSVGMFFAVFNLASILITLYQHFTGTFPLDAASVVGNLGPSIIFMILFYWKSRVDA